jgi:predicted ATPase
MTVPFLRAVRLAAERIADPAAFPFALPAVAALVERELALAPVTYLVGENGSGKSTLLEAIAVAAGFNAEGGTKNFHFATRRSESELHRALVLVRSHRRPRDGFFLRAESFFNVATEIERLGVAASYGEKSLHEQSHGESFFSLFKHRFGGEGLYLLDEPEAALSPARQLALLVRIHDLVRSGSQLVVATHAPIVLAYPGAKIYQLDATGITEVAYDEAEPVALTRDFLRAPARYVARLLADEG